MLENNILLASTILVLFLGFLAGQISKRFGLPQLVGMILVGLAIGPESPVQALKLFDQGNPVFDAANDLRVVAVMVILMKAGLGLDHEKLRQQSTVAIRLGFLPAAAEALTLALAASFLLDDFDFPRGLLLGCIIAAESPAVIVPGMLHLKSIGLGVVKGIPDAILTGCALSDVWMLLVFSLLLDFQPDTTAAADSDNLIINQLTFLQSLEPVQILPVQLLIEICLGLAIGFLSAKILGLFSLGNSGKYFNFKINRNSTNSLSGPDDSWRSDLSKTGKWVRNVTQCTIISGSVALFLVIFTDTHRIYSGYVSVAVMGFFLVQFNAPFARLVRSGFDAMWTVAEIFLFVLLGATVNLSALGNAGGIWRIPILLILGLLVGRSLGLFLSTLGNDTWGFKEKAFLLPGTMAKATVQASIGALPLAADVAGGEIILAIATVSVLTTAPLGAWSIQYFAPKLLEKGTVDPTKVAIVDYPTFLAAVDVSGSSLTKPVLRKAADLARRTNGELLVLHIGESGAIDNLKKMAQPILADIRHDFVPPEKVKDILVQLDPQKNYSKNFSEKAKEFIPDIIVKVAEDFKVADVIIGQRDKSVTENLSLGSVSRAVLRKSNPDTVILVKQGDEQKKLPLVN